MRMLLAVWLSADSACMATVATASL
eukprot:COSAG03_NODE_17726_length_369_cov_1.188889_1_plen_24_part_10